MMVKSLSNRCAIRARLLIGVAATCLPIAVSAEEGATALPPISVQGEKVEANGSARDGYKVDRASVGPLGDKRLEDTPYEINVVSSALIRDAGASSLNGILKYLPSAQINDYGPSGSGPTGGIGRAQTRGFYGSVIGNTRINGLNAWVPTLPSEAFDRLEVLNGLSGSLYGAANPSGTFNYVMRRPTEDQSAEVKGGYRRNGVGGVFLDINSGFLDHAIAFRFTAGYEDGAGWMDGGGSHYHRDFQSLGVDWRVSEQTTIETNILRGMSSEVGYAGLFFYNVDAKGASTVALPRPIDPTKAGYGQTYYPSDVTNFVATLKAKHQFNSEWSLVAGGLYETNHMYTPQLSNTLNNSAGGYTTTLTHPTVPHLDVSSIMAYLNGHFDTFGFGHDIVIGTNGYRGTFNFLAVVPNALFGKANVTSPIVYPYALYNYNAYTYRGMLPWEQSFIFGDTLTITPQWQLMFTASYDWIHNSNKNVIGATASSYSNSGLSPSASLIFKPVDSVTAYFTYASSLQQGDVAPASATNALQGIPPYRSEQYELGAKAKLFGLDFTADIFKISRPFANVDASKVYRIVGTQVNNGFEFFCSGRFLEDWTVFGGVTLIDPRLRDTGIFTTNGKDVVGIPRTQANMLVQYDLPLLRGLTLGANIHYTSKRAADDANTIWIGDYATLDLLARYVTKIYDHETTFRLNANNVTNTRYWASIVPSSLAGSGAGSYRVTPGVPFDISASVAMSF